MAWNPYGICQIDDTFEDIILAIYECLNNSYLQYDCEILKSIFKLHTYNVICKALVISSSLWDIPHGTTFLHSTVEIVRFCWRPTWTFITEQLYLNNLSLSLKRLELCHFKKITPPQCFLKKETLHLFSRKIRILHHLHPLVGIPDVGLGTSREKLEGEPWRRRKLSSDRMYLKREWNQEKNREAKEEKGSFFFFLPSHQGSQAACSSCSWAHC